MTSRIWPTPTEAELAEGASALEEVVCVACGMTECECEGADDDDCEGHDYCDTCESCISCEECTCGDVFVIYATTISVCVDWEGDIISVIGNSDLAEPYDVQFEDGSRVPDGPLRDRALTNVRERDWPNWDWS